MRIEKLGCKMDIYSGQIMGRVLAEDNNDVKAKVFKVIVPKAITSDGFISVKDLAEEKLKETPDKNRVTKLGDIVIKLSTPYDSALITEETVDCVIPSFCALIRNVEGVDKNYLLAFLNSKICKEQLKSKVLGSVMTILSVGKIKDVEIPLPDKEEQYKIGKSYREVQEKVATLQRIIELESKKNDVLFYDMVK